MKKTTLTEEQRLLRNEYQRIYRKKNPEKIIAINERHWRKKLGKYESQSNNSRKE